MKPTQDDLELADFCEVIESEGCSSYLEIGSKAGHSLSAVYESLSYPGRVVSVDLVSPNKASGQTLIRLVEQLDGTLIVGDSTDPKIVKRVGRLAPFDLVFIDANHTIEYATLDWINYGPMGHMIAFHDISSEMGVALLWERIKGKYRHIEIRHDTSGERNGIGVLWR
jgi:predicted O-methyltransferase YrrM